MRLRSTHVAAPLLVSIILAGAAAPAAALGACVQGQRPGCCCHGEEAKAPPAHARLEGRCCCEVEQQSTPAVPRTDEAATSTSGHRIAAPAQLFTSLGVDRAHVTLPRRAHVAPFATGPPLFLLTRSLLI